MVGADLGSKKGVPRQEPAVLLRPAFHMSVGGVIRLQRASWMSEGGELLQVTGGLQCTRDFKDGGGGQGVVCERLVLVRSLQ